MIDAVKASQSLNSVLPQLMHDLIEKAAAQKGITSEFAFGLISMADSTLGDALANPKADNAPTVVCAVDTDDLVSVVLIIKNL